MRWQVKRTKQRRRVDKLNRSPGGRIMHTIKNVKERLRKYPTLIAHCSESSGHYAICVIRKANVEKDDCREEFARFKACLVDAAKSNKTKL